MPPSAGPSSAAVPKLFAALAERRDVGPEAESIRFLLRFSPRLLPLADGRDARRWWLQTRSVLRRKVLFDDHGNVSANAANFNHVDDANG